MRRLAQRLLRRLGFELKRAPLDGSAGGDVAAYVARAEGMIGLDVAALLYELARRVEHGCIVEVGSYRGRSAVALGRGSIDGHRVPVYAIEPHEEFVGALGGRFGAADRGRFYEAMLASRCYEIVRLVNLSSEIVAPNWRQPVGLLWIDGDHSYDGVCRDWACWAPHLAPGATVAFDDATDPSLGPRRLIERLVAEQGYREVRRVGPVVAIAKPA